MKEKGAVFVEELLQRMEQACAQYLGGELEDTGFQQVIDEIPAEVWQDKDSALEIVRALVENEDLYEASLDKPGIFAEFICRLLPQGFFENPDYVLGTAEIIANFMATFDEGLSCYDVSAVFSFMPQTLWEDDQFATAAANIVIDRAYSMYDLNCISEVIPESVWKNEDDLVWLVRRLGSEDERNMAQLSLPPQKSWESAKVIFEILSGLQDALENDRAWGTVYCNFRGNDERYFENFLDCVPERFKSNKSFVLNLLAFDYFLDAFGLVYDWIDQSLWSDKEFVMKALELDGSAVLKVSDQLATDEEFKTYVDETFDLEWEIKRVPQEKIPQWIKNWKG